MITVVFIRLSRCMGILCVRVVACRQSVAKEPLLINSSHIRLPASTAARQLMFGARCFVEPCATHFTVLYVRLVPLLGFAVHRITTRVNQFIIDALAHSIHVLTIQLASGGVSRA